MKMQRVLRMTPTRRKPTIRVPLPDLCSSPKQSGTRTVSYTHLDVYKRQIQLHREQELIEALMKEQARIRAENGLPQRLSLIHI